MGIGCRVRGFRMSGYSGGPSPKLQNLHARPTACTCLFSLLCVDCLCFLSSLSLSLAHAFLSLALSLTHLLTHSLTHSLTLSLSLSLALSLSLPLYLGSRRLSLPPSLSLSLSLSLFPSSCCEHVQNRLAVQYGVVSRLMHCAYVVHIMFEFVDAVRYHQSTTQA